jgi:hypothetical protein
MFSSYVNFQAHTKQKVQINLFTFLFKQHIWTHGSIHIYLNLKITIFC